MNEYKVGFIFASHIFSERLLHSHDAPRSQSQSLIPQLGAVFEIRAQVEWWVQWFALCFHAMQIWPSESGGEDKYSASCSFKFGLTYYRSVVPHALTPSQHPAFKIIQWIAEAAISLLLDPSWKCVLQVRLQACDAFNYIISAFHHDSE